jgi:hypothetical protein
MPSSVLPLAVALDEGLGCHIFQEEDSIWEDL